MEVTTGISINSDYITDSFKIGNIKFIKTERNQTNKKVLICFILNDQNDKHAYCYKFYILNYIGEFYGSIKFLTKCRNEIYGMNLGYLYEKNEVAFSCSYNNGSLQAVFFDAELTTQNNYTYKQFTSCEEIYGFSVLYINNIYYQIN